MRRAFAHFVMCITI